jgi:hypothetical protein
MQNHNWINLLRIIPESRHNTLVLTTLSGVDLAIETVLRMEPTYLVFRGRVCGQTDDGRVFFLPYRQVDFLQINRSVSEAEINEVLNAPSEDLAGELDMGPQGSALEITVISPPKSDLSVGAPPASSPQAAPAAAPRPAAPARAAGSQHGRAANSAPSGPHVPAAPASSNANGNGSPAAAPRNSILERLRAQRNAVLPTRSPQR